MSSTADAPIQIGHVTLLTRDAARLAQFYRDVIGLSPLHNDGPDRMLGVEGRPLVILRQDSTAPLRDPRQAGLFHTAFLLPGRAALAEWLLNAAERKVRLEGASDHIVSEAIYLSDPEGNGIEVYADRPRAGWTGPDGRIKMDTNRLDLQALAADAQRPWAGAPVGTVVGHVHLQVGDVLQAEEFYRGLGFDLMATYPSAAFMGAGGYHHHIGLNVWNSAGAGPRPYETGLAELTLLADAAADSVSDPWGTRIVTRARAFQG
jgi:catechol 2,3-dioxygenase